MEPQQFCDAPLIPKIAIQDIQPYSVIVSWQTTREHLGLSGYEIVYHAIADGSNTPPAVLHSFGNINAIIDGDAPFKASASSTVNNIDIDEVNMNMNIC